MESAETTTRDLTGLVQQVLKSNVNMSRRLRNIERMHPAMMSSACLSLTATVHEYSVGRLSDAEQSPKISFEKELEHSAAYNRRTAFNRLRASNNSSNAPSGLSFLSGLSLSDVLDVTAMALPISRTELWNHHRYDTQPHSNTTHEASTLDAWYNPPAKVGSFDGIRLQELTGRNRKALSSERRISTANIPISMHKPSSLATLSTADSASQVPIGHPDLRRV